MPLQVNIPEARRVLRLAAALSTASSRHATGMSAEELEVAVYNYFAVFPWAGRSATKTVALKPAQIDTATVGQYFLAFNWEGRRGIVLAPVEIAPSAPARKSTTTISALGSFFNE